MASRSRIAGFVLCALVAAGGAQAQSGSGRPMGAPRDTTHHGWRYVYLIRHGWYDYGDRRDPRIGKGLDSLGRVQAKLVGERLASLPVRINSLTSSTFTRAMETADDIGVLLHMQPQRDSLISECGSPSMRPEWDAHDTQAELDTCQARMERAFARYIRPAEGPEDVHDVLVAHGNVIRWFTVKALGLDTRHWSDLDVGNASITAIAVRPDGTTHLVAFSDTGHLPAEIQTWTGRGAGWSPRPPRHSRPAVPGLRPGPGGIVAPAPAAAADTLRHGRPTDR